MSRSSWDIRHAWFGSDSEGLINSDSRCKWTESRQFQFTHTSKVTVPTKLPWHPSPRDTSHRPKAFDGVKFWPWGTGSPSTTPSNCRQNQRVRGGKWISVWHWCAWRSLVVCFGISLTCVTVVSLLLVFEEVHLLRCDPASSFDHACNTVHYRPRWKEKWWRSMRESVERSSRFPHADRWKAS